MSQIYFNSVAIPRPGDFGGGHWALTGLGGITAIFGKNGSGKSRLLRAWRDEAPNKIHYVMPERVGELTFEPSFLAREIDAEYRRDNSNTNYNADYRRHVVARIQAYFLTRGSVRGDAPPGDPAVIEALISTIIPDFDFRLIGTQNPPFALSRSVNRDPIGDIRQLSSGEGQLISIALDVLTIAGMWDIQQNNSRLILIDEPDAHIHPDLQVRLAEFLVKAANQFKLQIVVATHSTALLAALGQFAGTEAAVLYLDRTKSDFRATPFNKQTKELSACLGGHALMGPLFGVPMLLVEGDDDYRLWSQVPRHHVVNLCVIPANGDEIRKYQKTLEVIFDSLRDRSIPAGFALLDGDKPLPIPTPQVPQHHIKFLRLACHESENLYLADEVLSHMNTRWPEASLKIQAQAKDFGSKEPLLSSAPTWNRQTVDIHEIIEEITTILDPRRVHWTLRVARALGEKRPTGQLLDFLGPSVVEPLWGGKPLDS